jgi:hypothetical protein
MGRLNSKIGQARLVEIFLSLIVMLLGLLTVNSLNVVVTNLRSYERLTTYCNKILFALEENEALYELSYGKDASGMAELARSMISSVVPPSYGFNLTIYDKKYEIVWSVAERFNPQRSASSSFVYLTFNGREEVRVIVLSLSGEG